jgi:hypothetical protein
MIRLAGLSNPLLRELNETLYQFEQPFISDASKFERAFGPFPTDLTPGSRATHGGLVPLPGPCLRRRLRRGRAGVMPPRRTLAAILAGTHRRQPTRSHTLGVPLSLHFRTAAAVEGPLEGRLVGSGPTLGLVVTNELVIKL